MVPWDSRPYNDRVYDVPLTSHECHLLDDLFAAECHVCPAVHHCPSYRCDRYVLRKKFAEVIFDFYEREAEE